MRHRTDLAFFPLVSGAGSLFLVLVLSGLVPTIQRAKLYQIVPEWMWWVGVVALWVQAGVMAVAVWQFARDQ